MKYKDDRGYATAAVDMIFVSSSTKILKKECPDVEVSDHLPLVVELEI
jgi:endonuclease/exonuclease/phosphatase family metal-dependent hydrolase